MLREGPPVNDETNQDDGELIEKPHYGVEESPSLDELDTRIENRLAVLKHEGIDIQTWRDKYDSLPSEISELKDFEDELSDFEVRREVALLSLEFVGEIPEEEKLTILRFDQEVRASYKNPNNFLGNGATAEVYEMTSNDVICVKFITDQDRYDENNHIRKEFDFLSKVYEETQDGAVRTPYPIFCRIHAKEGHSYGMEKIHGASLSQITEFPDRYADLLTAAHSLDRQQAEADLLAFVEQMHQSGVAHCDLFRRNIMLGDDGRLYVIDFGKAKNIDFAEDREERIKTDYYVLKQALQEFFSELEGLTN